MNCSARIDTNCQLYGVILSFLTHCCPHKCSSSLVLKLAMYMIAAGYRLFQDKLLYTDVMHILT